MEFLTNEEIRKNAPTVFAKASSSETSDKYVHIPTYRLIEDMAELGWGVTKAVQVKARKNTTRGFQKHMIVFRNPDLMIKGEDGDDVFPQLLVTNSHDGKNSFKFTAGLFRLVCSNGLVIVDEEFKNMKIRHMGYSFTEVQKIVKEVIAKLPLTIGSMNKLKSKKMSQVEIDKFTKDALNLRFGKEVGMDMEELKYISEPIRDNDEGNNVWTVFNVIQEKLISGGFSYINPNAIKKPNRKARSIKSFDKDMKLNQELFNLALEYA